MLRASAIITRAGVFPYDAASLGVESPAKRTLMVERSRSVLSDPQTLASVRGAAVTLGHPANDVGPSNWQDLVVGNVVGEPRIDKTGNLVADILIGRQDAIAAVEGGRAELSIGYEFRHKPAMDRNTADLVTDGPIHVNHVAIVDRGRAGPGVRILDEESGDMSAADLKAIKDAIDKAIVKDSAPAAAAQIDTAALATAIMAGMSPMMDAMRQMNEGKDRGGRRMEEEKDTKDSKDAGNIPPQFRRDTKDGKDAAAAADELIKAATLEERRRSTLLHDAAELGILPPERVASLRDAALKDIQIAIMGDAISVADAATIDENYLQGRVEGKIEQARATGVYGTTGAQSLPAGVGRVQDRMGAPALSGGTTKARDDYIKRLNAWPPVDHSTGKPLF